jgi:AraC-like DNA-binding protein
MRRDEHVNEIVFASEILKIGRWRLPASHASFADSGPARNYLVVFPRTSAWIQHAGKPAFVADPNIVTLYNQHQEYTRRPIAPVGDWCEYYAIAPDVLRQIVAAWDPASADEPSRILRLTHARADAQTYLAQRAVYRHVRATDMPDAMFVEETMVSLVSRVLGSAYERPSAANASQRDLVEHVRQLLAGHFSRRFTLTELAVASGASVFHLCRVFRAVTGTTIHAYRNQLRLRAALAAVLDSRRDLSTLALDLGYSTHSHFTAAFRACYGLTPSAARREYVPSKATVHVFPPSDDCSQN